MGARLSCGVLALLVAGGCHDAEAGAAAGQPFVALDTSPGQGGRLELNRPVCVRFSHPVDLTTVTWNSVRFEAFDGASGAPLAEHVVGEFRYGRDEDGRPDPRILEIVPRWPTSDAYDDGGFKPGRRYALSFSADARPFAGVIRDRDGRALDTGRSAVQQVTFHTPSGPSPRELFFDPKEGPPVVTAVEVAPRIGDRVSLNELGGLPVEVRIRFDQPLDPHSSNVPVRADRDPARWRRRDRGAIHLLYDDPELGRGSWIPSQAELLNDNEGAVVVLRPEGILPNDATIRVYVAATLRDAVGEWNAETPRYDPIAGWFDTVTSYSSQFDALVLDFEDQSCFEAEQPGWDPVAGLQDGVLGAALDTSEFEDEIGDWAPTGEIILNTDFCEVVPTTGPPRVVRGGVFCFRDIHIPTGVTVRGVGTNPLVLLASREVRVDGTVSVDGGLGGSGIGLNSANVAVAGGNGVCLGGKGGRGSPEGGRTSPRGEDGYPGHGSLVGGGRGGRLACNAASSGSGSGGGGGSFATRGDPDYNADVSPPTNGYGGAGSSPAGVVPGGEPGALVFQDRVDDNDFWGRGVDPSGTVIVGELQGPQGGGGGGGGGDRTAGSASDPCMAVTFVNDECGGGGGGGGGVVVIRALGRITVGRHGRITANGGNGGGGEDKGSCRQGGGGGGGAGGMVVLASATGIDLYRHGRTWAEHDSDFALSADGGIGINTGFGNPVRLRKYPRTTGATNAGGFGGMGVVQLMTPPGRDGDGTGSRLDDNLRVLDEQGSPVSPEAKLACLWRGDIRPNPVLMPTPISRFSRRQTRWIWLGAVARREVDSGGGGPRSIRAPDRAGPDYRFLGLVTEGSAAGYLATDPATGRPVDPAVELAPGKRRVAVRTLVCDETGCRIELEPGALPADGSLAGFVAVLLGEASNEIARARIARHDDTNLWLAGEPTAVVPAKLEVHASFVDVACGDRTGLGEVYLHTERRAWVPRQNVQIGFAFHRDPAQPDIVGDRDLNRWPQELDRFEFDPTNLAVAARHLPFVQMMFRFNSAFDPDTPDEARGPEPLSPETPRLEIRALRLPFRF